MDDGVLGDFVKDDPLDLDAGLFLVQPEGRQQMPGDRLPFTVGVGCQQQSVGALRAALDGIDMLLALRQDIIFRLKAIFDIHRPLLARQGTDMAEGGQDP